MKKHRQYIFTTKRGHWAKYVVTYPSGTQFSGDHFFSTRKSAISFIEKWAKLATPMEVA